jgi:LPS-assembly protein
MSHKLKHTIEPRLTYNYTTGVKNFAIIQRFDERDILSNTNEVQFAVVNRLYAKPAGKDCSKSKERQPAGDCSSREIVSWELAQKYFIDPTFGGAVLSGKRNVFTTTEELTGIAFLTQPRRFSPIVSRLRMRGPNTDAEWHLDYDTKLRRINSSMALLDYKFLGDFHLGGGHTFLETPPSEILAPGNAAAPSRFNQFRVLAAYGNVQKAGFAAGTTVGFDAKNGILQYSAMLTTYNWDCCGVTIEYRRWNIGAVRNENQFRFALSLSNVGTFGTLRKQERLF